MFFACFLVIEPDRGARYHSGAGHCRMKGWSSAKVPDLISVIVTTYNREDALEAVLSSLSRQSDRGFEVVVADDGPRATTPAGVERCRPPLGVPLDHLVPMNCGFRPAEIRHQAILLARGHYSH